MLRRCSPLICLVLVGCCGTGPRRSGAADVPITTTYPAPTVTTPVAVAAPPTPAGDVPVSSPTPDLPEASFCRQSSPARRVSPPDANSAYAVECIELYVPIAADVWRVHETTQDPSVRATAAYILAKLWDKRLLSNELKDAIVDRYYRPVLVQLLGYGRLELTVHAQLAFPFPSNWVTVRFTLYRNGHPEAPTLARSGEWNIHYPNTTLTSRGGGSYAPGDQFAYDIVLEEEIQPAKVIWRKVLRTNTVVAR